MKKIGNQKSAVGFLKMYPEVCMISHTEIWLNIGEDKITQSPKHMNKLYTALTASWGFLGKKSLTEGSDKELNTGRVSGVVSDFY